MGCCFGKSDDELPPAFDPVIGLSESLKGAGVNVDGLIISGNGSVMGDSPVLQDKAYFEVTLRKTGVFAVGVATRETGLDGVLSQEKASTAWTFTSSSSVPIAEGETVGVAFDQGDYPVQLCTFAPPRARVPSDARPSRPIHRHERLPAHVHPRTRARTNTHTHRRALPASRRWLVLTLARATFPPAQTFTRTARSCTSCRASAARCCPSSAWPMGR